MTQGLAHPPAAARRRPAVPQRFRHESPGAVLLARSLATGRPLSSTSASGALEAQRTVGNRALARLLGTSGDSRRMLSRGPPGTGLKPVTAPDTELWLSRGLDPPWRGTRITAETLADWAVPLLGPGLGEREIVRRIRSSHEFAGSQEAREYWATFVTQTGIEYLQAIVAAKRQAAAEARHREQQEEERRIERQRLAEFRARVYEGVEEFTNGFFRATYSPTHDELVATVSVQFDFKDSNETRTEVVDPGGPHPQLHNKVEPRTWTSEDEERWRVRFRELVEQAWSVHVLECRKPGWESLVAKVAVKVDEVRGDVQGPGTFDVKVYRGDNDHGTAAVARGRAWFSYDDIDSKPGEHPVVLHEFGHMLGLDDEYLDAAKPNATWAGHSELVRGEFGYGVPRLDIRDDRFKASIMYRSSTGKVLPEHGVVFLDAIRRITGVPEWGLRRVPL